MCSNSETVDVLGIYYDSLDGELTRHRASTHTGPKKDNREKRGRENTQASFIFIWSFHMSAFTNIRASTKQVYKVKSALT
jgi:hypothetical protein